MACIAQTVLCIQSQLLKVHCTDCPLHLRICLSANSYNISPSKILGPRVGILTTLSTCSLSYMDTACNAKGRGNPNL